SNIGADVEYDLGFADATLLLDHSNAASPLSNYQTNPFLGTIPPNNLGGGTSNTQQAELRLNSPAPEDETDNLKWVVGLYWQHAITHSRNWNRINVTGTSAPIGASQLSNSTLGVKSAFGQATYGLPMFGVANRLRITGGLRYSEETNANQSLSWNVGKHIVIGNRVNTDFKWDRLTYKAGIDFDITPENLLYGTLSTGFKPGTTSNDRFCVGNISGHFYHPGDGSGVVLPFPTG